MSPRLRQRDGLVVGRQRLHMHLAALRQRGHGVSSLQHRHNASVAHLLRQVHDTVRELLVRVVRQAQEAEHVVLVRVEAGREHDEVRPVLAHRLAQHVLEQVHVLLRPRALPQGDVHQPARQVHLRLAGGAGKERRLRLLCAGAVDGAEQHVGRPAGIPACLQAACLGAVAVVQVPVDDGNPPDGMALQSVARPHRHVVDEAEALPHQLAPLAVRGLGARRAGRPGVVPWGPHHAKGIAKLRRHHLVHSSAHCVGGAQRSMQAALADEGVALLC
mmetsp:Transcript_42176/g.106648  ORF Transcript_42176/g.106648 Transcript_42176/m.106648 type:complete len:274 (+) Transcript_42176:552-1373(+)